jgi:hypothetical protein
MSATAIADRLDAMRQRLVNDVLTQRLVWDDQVLHEFEANHFAPLNAQTQSTLSDMVLLLNQIETARRAVR